jgi:hypothetical protein
VTAFLDETRWSFMQEFTSLSMPVVIGLPDHPTLAEIAERDREIAYRRAMDTIASLPVPGGVMVNLRGAAIPTS